MAVTRNLYYGDGSTVLFSFTFPYLETTDVKVSVDSSVTTAYTFANATTIQFNTAPANGAIIAIYRQTDDAALAAAFYPGSAIRSQDLNDNFTQNLYVTQESNRDATDAVALGTEAVSIADGAVVTANAATATANTAASDASAAVSTANTASSNASAAVSTANTASANATTAVNTANAATVTANDAATDAATAISTANGAVSTANSAVSTANAATTTAGNAVTTADSAVSTANTASTNASNAVTTANAATVTAGNAVTTANSAVSTATGAVSTANTALSTANAAASAVANAILYDTVANVAAIPGSPSNNDAVEVVDSTGIESFTPLSGVPSGYVGDSGLSVRLVYTTAGSTWNWIQYFPNDPEDRYGDSIVTLQGDVSTAQSDITTLQSDVLGLDSSKLAIAGGTMTGALGVTAGSAASPAIYFDADTGIYSPGADQLALATNSVGRLFIDSSGNIGVGQSSPAVYFDIFKSGTTQADLRVRNGTSGLNLAIKADGTADISNVLNYPITFTTGTTPTEKVRITSDGLVGVGTSAPANDLDVLKTASGSTTTARIGATATSGANNATLILNNGGTGNSTLRFDYESSTNRASIGVLASDQKLTFSTAGSTAMTIDASQRLGIGSTGPQYPLHTETTGTGTAAGDNTAILVQSQASGRDCNIRFGDSVNASARIGYLSNNLYFYVNANERARIDSSGRLGIGTTSPSANGKLTVANTDQQGICFVNTDSSNKEWRIAGASTSLAVIQSGVGEALRIANTGALGLSGANYGSSGQVLTSQGSGAAPQWATPGGGANIQEFTSSGTWSKPSGATYVLVRLWGAGGGGRSGASYQPGYNTPGAGGGAGGVYTETIIKASDLPSTVSVTIGAGGAGGAQRNWNGSNSQGNNGSNGGNTSFSTYLTSSGGRGSASSSNTMNFGLQGNVGTEYYSTGYNSGSGGTQGAYYQDREEPYEGSLTYIGGAGGGGGGQHGSLDGQWYGGKAGGFAFTSSPGVYAQGANTQGGNGASGTLFGQGGGGAGSAWGGTGGVGGNGGRCGGGGGGGGAPNYGNGGAGGNGGDGFAQILSW